MAEKIKAVSCYTYCLLTLNQLLKTMLKGVPPPGNGRRYFSPNFNRVYNEYFKLNMSLFTNLVSEFSMLTLADCCAFFAGLAGAS